MNNLKKYIDDRGEIAMILESAEIGSVSLIRSHSGKTRANHYHLTDTHFIYIVKGNMEIYERPINNHEKPLKKILNVNDLWFTNFGTEHTMYFPIYCDFWCFSKLPRNQSNYESETVRFDYDLRNIYNNWKD